MNPSLRHRIWVLVVGLILFSFGAAGGCASTKPQKDKEVNTVGDFLNRPKPDSPNRNY